MNRPKHDSVSMPQEYRRFKASWDNLYGEAPEVFLREQFDLMAGGIRDVRIHDNTFTVWDDIGPVIYS